MEDDDAAFHAEMRRRIQAVQRDASLSAADKGRAIQALMTSRWRESSPVAPTTDPESAAPRVTFSDEAAGVHGCAHYETHCSIQAHCCQRWYTCRRCHDEREAGHAINRYATERMFCFFCHTEQPVAQTCEACGKCLAKYFCGVCKLWSDGANADRIFHCAKCGLCRVGEGEYEHCDVCHMCLPKSDTPHKHMDRAFDCNCPICGEYLFTSTRAATMPEPCRHPIHAHCYRKLLRNLHYACPVCHKTYTDIDMAASWAYMRNLVATNPMPPEYAEWRVEVLCNDCERKCVVPFHFFGAQCTTCGGYNTSTVATLRPSTEAVSQPDSDTGGSGTT